MNWISALVRETLLSSLAPSTTCGYHVRIQGEVCDWERGTQPTTLGPEWDFQAPEL